jgi:hypothetical protein
MRRNQRGLGTLVLLIGVVIAAALIAGGWYYWQNQDKNKTSGNSSTASGDWVEYKNDQYGLKFSYLKAWGEPKITESTLQGSKVYDVAFSDIDKSDSSRDKFLSLRFELSKNDDIKCITDDPCVVATRLTKEVITRNLSNNPDKYLKHDDKSYTVLINKSKQNVLVINQIVSLPRINSSATGLSYSLLSPAETCPKDKLSATSTENCISENDYTNFKKLLDSISSI